jgi:hypothetical protein
MYYPKSQIKTNLYTYGDEYVITLTQAAYTGYYFLTSTGQAFTGRTPDDRPNQELTKVDPVTKNEGGPLGTLKNSSSPIFSAHNPFASNIINEVDILSSLDYAQITNTNIFNPSEVLVPYYIAPTPTEQDYQIGEFRRYFCKKGNEILYLEIDKTQYDLLVTKSPSILFSLYGPFNLPWQITGTQEQVARTNKNIVDLTSQRLKLPRFGDYLNNNYLKYYR